MPKTLLQLGQDACIRAGLSRPSQIFGATHQTARRLTVAAEDTIRDMAERGGRTGWSDLRSEWIFPLRAGHYAFPLPEDFLRPVIHTFHREGSPFSMLAPSDPAQWTYYRLGPSRPAAPYAWRVSNGMLLIEPPATGSEIMRFEYQSRFMVVRTATEADYQLMGEIDGMPWYLPLPGIVPVEGQLSVSPLQSGAVGSGSWDTAPPGWDEATWDGTLGAYYKMFRRQAPLAGARVRSQYFAADTDEPAFRYEHPIGLGITWRLLQQLRQPYAEAMAAYERSLRIALAWDNGGAHDIMIGAECPDLEAYPTADPLKWTVS